MRNKMLVKQKIKNIIGWCCVAICIFIAIGLLGFRFTNPELTGIQFFLNSWQPSVLLVVSVLGFKWSFKD